MVEYESLEIILERVCNILRRIEEKVVCLRAVRKFVCLVLQSCVYMEGFCDISHWIEEKVVETIYV